MQDGMGDGTIQSRTYQLLAERFNAYSIRDLATLWKAIARIWGRILGHELVVTIVKVGSRVDELTEGIGYREAELLTPDDLTFELGECYVVQSRIAHYRPPLPPLRKPVVRGVQLLGGNITDLAMELNGGYAQYVRLNRQMIQSGSILRIPAGVDPVSAALAEPAACLLDCLEKSTHEAGHSDRGILHKKGVLPGGLTAVIGSGSMALLAGMLALMEDPIIEVGGAAEVVFFVRSERKADLVRRILPDPRVHVVLCTEDEQMHAAALAQYAPGRSSRTGHDFRGFDDVIVAAGDSHTLAHAHELMGPTGARVLAFAGSRGDAHLDSGLWHYGNAGTSGSSGCNTKMMEIALGLMQRGSLKLSALSGKGYSFAALQDEGVNPFFDDRHLRPRLSPNAGLKEWNW
jgi:threonine dehydrogenase-like Zn-dependent dehydrogenase